MSNERTKLTKAETQFAVDGKTVKFTIVHSLPDIPGLSYDDALQNWMARCSKFEDFTADSLVSYILGKGTGHICLILKDYERLMKNQ